MKLHRLKLLSDFRGLSKGFSVDFAPHQKNGGGAEPICLVGLNGSGKSNVLEVLSEIFYYLETYHLAPQKELDSFKTSYGFEIKYSIPRNTYEMARVDWPELSETLGDTKSYIVFQITKKTKELPTITAHTNKGVIPCHNKDYNRNIGVLPSRIIGYSSGMNELISNPFIKIDFHYLQAFEKLAGKSQSSNMDVNRMFYMDYASNKLVTVANFLFDKEGFDKKAFKKGTDLKEFGAKDLSHLKKELNISKLHSFSISLKLRNNYNKSIEIPGELNLAIEKLKKCATLFDESENKSSRGTYRVVDLFFWVNKATQQAFQHHFKTAYELYRSLYLLALLNNFLVGQKLRKEITHADSDINISAKLPKHEDDNLVFSINDIAFRKKRYKDPIFYKQLSDGEHQLLHVLGTIMLMDTPGALFILDEPETHFNPEWRSQFVSILNRCLAGESREQEYILTSHSPFIVSDCRQENVFSFFRNKKNKVAFKEIGFNTYGASVNYITMKVFGKKETISGLALSELKEITGRYESGEIDITQAIEEVSKFGDSIEKTLFLNSLGKLPGK